MSERSLRAAAAVPCSGCGAEIDSLRAGHVAIFQARFHFFCDYRSCRQRFLAARAPSGPSPRDDLPRPTSEPRGHALAAPISSPEPLRPAFEVPAPLPPPGPELIEALGAAPSASAYAHDAADDERDAGAMLVALALVAGLLATALELAQPTRVVGACRLVLVAVAVAALVGRTLTHAGDDGQARPGARDPAAPHWLAAVLPPSFGLAVATAGLAAAPAPTAARAIFLAATIVSAGAANLWLVDMAARPVRTTRRRLRARLGTSDVGAGEPVALEANGAATVDLVIEEGEAEVLPPVGEAVSARRGPGDAVVAGSRIVAGALRGRCSYAGDDRALARPVLDDTRRPDIHAAVSRLPRAIAVRGSLGAAVVAALLALVLRQRPIEIAMVAVAVQAAIGGLAIGALPALAVARGAQLALRRGIVYLAAGAWERAASVSAAAFCARGTLLRGEPEVVEIELFPSSRPVAKNGALGGDFEPSAARHEVLALAASALAAERSPMAVAVKRAAQAFGLPADAARNAHGHGAEGVTAMTPAGEPLCVGTRALMIERRISVASAEPAIAQLESAGRTILLVAKAGRLSGLIGLQDGLRSGARAAVQLLLEAHIEPVLMSSDTRETCEALGRALDVDHLRAEIGDDESGLAVRRIQDAGAVVAAIGHSPHDDPALAAADVSIALGAAGKAAAAPNALERGVALVGEDVRDAALALALAQRWRRRAIQVLALALAPAAFGSLVVAAGLLPAEYAPLAGLLGAAAATLQLLADDRAS